MCVHFYFDYYNVIFDVAKEFVVVYHLSGLNENMTVEHVTVELSDR